VSVIWTSVIQPTTGRLIAFWITANVCVMWVAAVVSWEAAQSWTNSESSSLADRLIFRSAVRDAVWLICSPVLTHRPTFLQSLLLTHACTKLNYRFITTLRHSEHSSTVQHVCTKCMTLDHFLLTICVFNLPNEKYYLMFIGPCIIAIVDEWKTNLMLLAILFH